MAKLFVKVAVVHSQVVEVDALDEDDARNVASEILSTGIQQDGTALPEDTSYNYTIESSEWLVFQ
jgi:hypothetical protein